MSNKCKIDAVVPSSIQIILHPTYDVDQSTTSEYIRGIVLWLGQYIIMILPCGEGNIVTLPCMVNKRLVGYKPVKAPQAGQSGVNALVRNHKYTYTTRASPSCCMY